MAANRKHRFAVFAIAGAIGFLLSVSWLRIWRVETETSWLLMMDIGTFWQFLDDLPSAVVNLGVPQTPDTFMTILPTVYLWENVGTTLVVLAIGAVVGVAFSWFTLPNHPPADRSCVAVASR